MKFSSATPFAMAILLLIRLAEATLSTATPSPPSPLVSEPQLQAMLDGVRAQGQRRWSRHLRSSVRRGAAEEQLHGLVERVLQSELRQPSAQKCQKHLTVTGGKLRVYCHTFFQSEPRSEQVQSLLL